MTAFVVIFTNLELTMAQSGCWRRVWPSPETHTHTHTGYLGLADRYAWALSVPGLTSSSQPAAGMLLASQLHEGETNQTVQLGLEPWSPNLAPKPEAILGSSVFPPKVLLTVFQWLKSSPHGMVWVQGTCQAPSFSSVTSLLTNLLFRWGREAQRWRREPRSQSK